MSNRWVFAVAVVGAWCAFGAPAPTASAKRPASTLGSTKEDDELPTPSGPGADIALLRATLWAVEPAPLEIRVQAIEDLGLLGDPRVLNLLAQLVVDPNPAIARAALRGVSLLRHPRAEEILGNVVRHPSLPEPLKLQALELLPLQNTASAITTLTQVVNGKYSWALQGAARKALTEVPAARGGLP
ncbi:MAG: HEAT repeat domain-containing protein [Archangium sp.]|nr:HEAT repeat domain-containing protein [Archangium sp.]